MTLRKYVPIDKVFAILQNKAKHLKAVGQHVTNYYKGYKNEHGSLVEWFHQNLDKIKAGTDELLVATAAPIYETNINNRICWRDTLTISSSPTKDGLLVEIRLTTHEYIDEDMKINVNVSTELMYLK